MADTKPTLNRPRPLPWLLDLDPYVGGESKIEGVSRIIKLASNESAFGISPKAQKALEGLAADFFRYPDGGCTDLQRAVPRDVPDRLPVRGDEVHVGTRLL